MSEIRQKVQDVILIIYFKKILNTEANTNSKNREMTNGIVNDLKSKIQNFKNKKSLEKENTKTCELDIEVNKELLGKFRKSESNTNILAQNQNLNQNINVNVNNPTTTPVINLQKPPVYKDLESKLDVSTVSIKTNGLSSNSNIANRKINSLLKEINFSSDDKTTKIGNSNFPAAKEEKLNPTSDVISASNNSRPIKTFLNLNNDKKNKDDEK